MSTSKFNEFYLPIQINSYFLNRRACRGGQMSHQKLKLNNLDMVRALYDFTAKSPKMLTFLENDHFIINLMKSKKTNWWHAINADGQMGFIPSNYVVQAAVTPEFRLQFLENCIDAIKSSDSCNCKTNEKQDLLLSLVELQRKTEVTLGYSNTPPPPIEFRNKTTDDVNVQKLTPDTLAKYHSSDNLEFSLSESSLPNNKLPAAVSVNAPKEKNHKLSKREQRHFSFNNGANERIATNDYKRSASEDDESRRSLSQYRRNKSDDDFRRMSDDYTLRITHDDYRSADRRRYSHEFCGAEELKPRHHRKSTNDLTWSRNDIAISSSDTSETRAMDYRVPRSRSRSDARRRGGGHVDVGANGVHHLIEQLRKNTQLSHNMSKVALITVVEGLRELLPTNCRAHLSSILQYTENYFQTPDALIAKTHDSSRLRTIFSELTSCKEDSQQRSWMLYEDETIIKEYLTELISILNNADLTISRHALSLNQYNHICALIQYYQMETRWPIRQLLLQAFGVMCNLDKNVIIVMLNSVLPMELSRDMRANPRSASRLNYSALLLTMIFSMGEKMPVHHLEYIGLDFITFILKHIESPPPELLLEQIFDPFLNLILAYNLQFQKEDENIVMLAIQKLGETKLFAEKILYLFNREEDPVRIFDHTPVPPHSVLKMINDLLNNEITAAMFYTNDIKVLIDIIIREISDLSPGDEKRMQYLELCRRILRNTNYAEHFHRKDDILKCFTRIFCEESEASSEDQKLVRKISNEFPQYFKS